MPTTKSPTVGCSTGPRREVKRREKKKERGEREGEGGRKGGRGWEEGERGITGGGRVWEGRRDGGNRRRKRVKREKF